MFDGDVLFLFGGDSTERSNTGRSGLEERHSVLMQPSNNQHTNDPNTFTLNTFTLARKKNTALKKSNIMSTIEAPLEWPRFCYSGKLLIEVKIMMLYVISEKNPI